MALLLISLLLPLVSGPDRFALAAAAGPLASSAAGGAQRLAVALVIDTSGSMGKTDPQALRQTAADVLVDLLSPDDFLSVTAFASDSRQLVPMQAAGDASRRTAFKAALATRLAAGGGSDFLLALQAAQTELDSLTDPGLRKVIVILTDGEPSPGKEHAADAVFMADYMARIWQSVAGLSAADCPIYAIGFSEGVDPAVLDRMASETRGSVETISEPASLAEELFRLLGQLKQRTTVADEVIELAGQATRPLAIDPYATHMTLVFTNSSGQPLAIDLLSGATTLPAAALTRQDADNYCIVSIDPAAVDLAGNCQVRLTGQGTVRMFGDKDSTIKAWLDEPAVNSQLPADEPLNLAVQVTGTTRSDLTVEATLADSKQHTVQTLLLPRQADVDGEPVRFTGQMTAIAQTGTYSLTIRSMLAGQEITRSASKIYVRSLPAIRTDFPTGNQAVQTGEGSTFTAELWIAGNRLPASKDLTVDQFQLQFVYSDGTRQIETLQDSGQADSGDIRGQDGIWTTRLTYGQTGSAEASISVRGDYHGLPFSLSKQLGVLKVYPPGVIRAAIPAAEAVSQTIRTLQIPVQLTSTSWQRETLQVGLDPSIGSVQPDQVTIEPGQTVTARLAVEMPANQASGTLQVPLTLTASRAQLLVEPAFLAVTVQYVKPSDLVLRQVRQLLARIWLPVVGLVGLLAAVWLLGLLLFRLRVSPASLVSGTLHYWPETDPGESSRQTIALGRLRQARLVLPLEPARPTAAAAIHGSRASHDLILMRSSIAGRDAGSDETAAIRRVQLGWQSLFVRPGPASLLIRVTAPGILVWQSQICTTCEIRSRGQFQTGGLVFEWIDDQDRDNRPDSAKRPGRKQARPDDGRNILDGKI